MQDSKVVEVSNHWLVNIVEKMYITSISMQPLLHVGAVYPDSVAAFLYISSN